MQHLYFRDINKLPANYKQDISNLPANEKVSLEIWRLQKRPPCAYDLIEMAAERCQIRFLVILPKISQMLETLRFQKFGLLLKKDA